MITALVIGWLVVTIFAVLAWSVYMDRPSEPPTRLFDQDSSENLIQWAQPQHPTERGN